MYLLKYFFMIFLFSGANSASAEEKKETTPPTRKKIEFEKIGEMTKKAKGFIRTNDYVHTWIKFPEAKGQALSGGTKITKARKGYITVFFFIASWNVKSQELISKFKELEKKYYPLNTDFVYIFSHDTIQDAQSFTKEYEISGGMLAEHEINKAFHNPKIPSVYVADRHGWLANRVIEVDFKKLAELDAYLQKITVL